MTCKRRGGSRSSKNQRDHATTDTGLAQAQFGIAPLRLSSADQAVRARPMGTPDRFSWRGLRLRPPLAAIEDPRRQGSRRDKGTERRGLGDLVRFDTIENLMHGRCGDIREKDCPGCVAPPEPPVETSAGIPFGKVLARTVPRIVNTGRHVEYAHVFVPVLVEVSTFDQLRPKRGINVESGNWTEVEGLHQVAASDEGEVVLILRAPDVNLRERLAELERRCDMGGDERFPSRKLRSGRDRPHEALPPKRHPIGEVRLGHARIVP